MLRWLALMLLHRQALANLYSPGSQVPLVLAQNGSIANCHRTCLELQEIGLVAHYPNLPPDFHDRFFATQQTDLRPLCAAEPSAAQDVATVVTAIIRHACPFAVVSGGHNTASGSNSVHNGLLLDLRRLNAVHVSEDRSTASVGPGNTWKRVFDELHPLGLAVVGGRVSSVGVGGFTMGGGVSYHSHRHGWAFDNVRNFEVVLPNGTLVNANPTSHPDVFFALRGGGSSFGIVTRFDFQTHPHELAWGGMKANIVRNLAEKKASLGLAESFDGSLHSLACITSAWVQRAAIKFLGYGVDPAQFIDAFLKLSLDEQTDHDAHAYLFFTWVPKMRMHSVGAAFFHSASRSSEGDKETPEVFREIAALPSIYDSTRVSTLTDFADEPDKLNPPGERRYWLTSTFRGDADFFKTLWDIVLEEAHKYRLAVPGMEVSTNLQLLTKHEIALFSRNGGNAFGLKPQDGPLFFFSITIRNVSPKDDEAAKTVGDAIMTRALALGKKLGLHHPFLYPNYAAAGQDVFAGYSPETRKRLFDIQERYDPGRAFASLQPEHFAFR